VSLVFSMGKKTLDDFQYEEEVHLEATFDMEEWF
jgi:hypothetical protein